MNVTNDRFKDKQLHIKDYLQMVSKEAKEYAEVSAFQRIALQKKFALNNHIIADVQTDNLNKAYKKVKFNKGTGSVDGVIVDELRTFLKDNQKQLI